MARKAAAVPASKAQIHKTYAVHYDGELVGFIVDRITTHRIDNTGSPHDYESEITGRYVIRDDEGHVTYSQATIRPDKLLGAFEDYHELVKQREIEEARKRKESEAANEVALELRSLLYRVIDIPAPENSREYHQPFRVGAYGGLGESVDMQAGRENTLKLRDGLKKLIEEAELAHSANLV